MILGVARWCIYHRDIKRVSTARPIDAQAKIVEPDSAKEHVGVTV